jgi:transposase
MSRRPRRNHTPGLKAKVALAAIKGDRTLAQLAADVFGPGGSNGVTQPAVDVKSLHAKIGALTLEKNKPECLGTPVQIVDHPRAVACFVR